ncbi:flagellar hook-length control protein FliK [Hydrogenovibrio kuenenii]|uniref:flagellar hook-length control protein FliK n=1 Tax=Hydrogenovibrio kuenenii TaxID=63658 RepID=UPI00046340EC|nr:flagellar hook-length control protein FliK [Hydrogenovibrio kuenenii]
MSGQISLLNAIKEKDNQPAVVERQSLPKRSNAFALLMAGNQASHSSSKDSNIKVDSKSVFSKVNPSDSTTSSVKKDNNTEGQDVSATEASSTGVNKSEKQSENALNDVMPQLSIKNLPLKVTKETASESLDAVSSDTNSLPDSATLSNGLLPTSSGADAAVSQDTSVSSSGTLQTVDSLSQTVSSLPSESLPSETLSSSDKVLNTDSVDSNLPTSSLPSESLTSSDKVLNTDSVDSNPLTSSSSNSNTNAIAGTAEQTGGAEEVHVSSDLSAGKANIPGVDAEKTLKPANEVLSTNNPVSSKTVDQVIDTSKQVSQGQMTSTQELGAVDFHTKLAGQKSDKQTHVTSPDQTAQEVVDQNALDVQQNNDSVNSNNSLLANGQNTATNVANNVATTKAQSDVASQFSGNGSVANSTSNSTSNSSAGSTTTSSAVDTSTLSSQSGQSNSSGQQGFSQNGQGNNPFSQNHLMNQMIQAQQAAAQQAAVKKFNDLSMADTASSDTSKLLGNLGLDSKTQLPPGLQGIAYSLRSPQWNQALGQRVVYMASNKIQEAKITLNPEKLGPVQIKLHMDKNQQLHVSMSAHHHMTKETMEAAVPKLREMLDSAGVDLGSIDVNRDNQFDAPQQNNEKDGQEKGGTLGQSFDGKQADQEVQPIVVKQTDSLIDYYA